MIPLPRARTTSAPTNSAACPTGWSRAAWNRFDACMKPLGERRLPRASLPGRTRTAIATGYRREIETVPHRRLRSAADGVRRSRGNPGPRRCHPERRATGDCDGSSRPARQADRDRQPDAAAGRRGDGSCAPGARRSDGILQPISANDPEACLRDHLRHGARRRAPRRAPFQKTKTRDAFSPTPPVSAAAARQRRDDPRHPCTTAARPLRRATEQAEAVEEAGAITSHDDPAGTLVRERNELVVTKDRVVQEARTLTITSPLTSTPSNAARTGCAAGIPLLRSRP